MNTGKRGNKNGKRGKTLPLYVFRREARQYREAREREGGRHKGIYYKLKNEKCKMQSKKP